MRRLTCLAWVTLALALVAPSCATGSQDTSTAEVADTSPEGGTPDGGCAVPCGAGNICSQGVCVPLTTDFDGDGYTVQNDCDDRDPAVHPGATEICNGKDDDCNGKTDEAFDADGDGSVTCALPGKPADCNDQDPTVHPGAVEACNNKDDNCDGKIDEGFDKDNDGYYSCAHGSIAADCNDGDPGVHPGASEACNGKDDDCDGVVDDIPASWSSTAAGKASLFPPLGPLWVVAGSAAFGSTLNPPSNGWVRLNADLPDQAGGLWFNANYMFDAFDMQASVWLQDKPTGADGMAFAWIAGSNVTALGSGPGYGVIGVAGGGYAVAIDTYQNAGTDGPVPFLALVNTTTTARIAVAAIPNIRNSAEHVLRVKLDGGKVSVFIDGTNYMNDVTIPGYAAYNGHWGFTAGTGGASEAHWVTNIAMTFPKGQGCVVPP